MPKRKVFFLSDRTGITVQMLGHSLLTQFPGVDVDRVTIPFVDTKEQMQKVLARIRQSAAEDEAQPLVFTTLVDTDLLHMLDSAEVHVFDFFDTYIPMLEREFGTTSSHSVGRAHGMGDLASYKLRVDAVNFALRHDDGVGIEGFHKADLVLVGVSRTGKTPTSLYLALQFGVRAANYPLTDEDMTTQRLPPGLVAVRDKLFGLNIEPERLRQIRAERRPDSRYCSMQQCRFEVQWAEHLFKAHRIPYLNTTVRSIEELAAGIMSQMGLQRRVY